MRILIRRGQFANKGAEAMVRTVQQEIGRRLPSATFVVGAESVLPGTGDQVDRAGLVLAEQRLSRWHKAYRVGREVLRDPRRAPQRLRNRQWITIQRTVEQVDAIVDVAGFAYGDTWGPRKAIQAGDYIAFARRRAVPYIFMPQAWGPFEQSPDHAAYRTIVDGAACVYARDEESQKFLTDLPGVSREIPLCPDIAFRFQGEDESFAIDWLAEHAFTVGTQPLVAIAPNQKVYERTTGKGGENTYVRCLVQTGKWIEQQGGRVLLIPHEIYPDGRPEADDRGLCRLVARELSKPLVVDEILSAERLKALVGLCSLLIGSRFHALIAGLSQKVPAVAIGWSHKYEGLFDDCGLSEFAIHRDALQQEQVVELVKQAWAERESLTARVEQRLVQIHRAVDNTFDAVASMIDSGARAK